MGKVISFLVGIASGAMLGLLLAPAPGVETRRKIRAEADRLADKLLKDALANKDKETEPVKANQVPELH